VRDAAWTVAPGAIFAWVLVVALTRTLPSAPRPKFEHVVRMQTAESTALPLQTKSTVVAAASVSAPAVTAAEPAMVATALPPTAKDRSSP
jgi:hypothetical protein